MKHTVKLVSAVALLGSAFVSFNAYGGACPGGMAQQGMSCGYSSGGGGGYHHSSVISVFVDRKSGSAYPGYASQNRSPMALRKAKSDCQANGGDCEKIGESGIIDDCVVVYKRVNPRKGGLFSGMNYYGYSSGYHLQDAIYTYQQDVADGKAGQAVFQGCPQD